jgi:hypothetical protein
MDYVLTAVDQATGSLPFNHETIGILQTGNPAWLPRVKLHPQELTSNRTTMFRYIWRENFCNFLFLSQIRLVKKLADACKTRYIELAVSEDSLDANWCMDVINYSD